MANRDIQVRGTHKIVDGPLK